MAYCGKCGKPVEDGRLFCPNCGAAMDQKESKEDMLKELSKITDHTSEFDPADIQQNKLMAILAYLGILVLIPIFAAKESKFAQYHANQGLVLAIAGVALWIVSSVVTTVLNAIFLWILSVIVSFVSGLASLVLVILAIIGIVYAAQGQAKELPIVGQIKILK